MNNPVGWFEIYVDDMNRAKQFYQSVFNVSLEKLSDPTDGHSEIWSFGSNFEQYGTSGALVKMDGFQAGGNSTLVYFSCEDCAIEEANVLKSGGTIKQTKAAIGEYGFCTLATDSEVNIIGLHSQS